MKIIAIEEKTFEQIIQHIKFFSERVKELCGNKVNIEWLDNQEVCQLLNISKRTLQSYRDNRILPYSQIGYKCFYKKKDIEKLIEKSIIKLENYGNKE